MEVSASILFFKDSPSCCLATSRLTHKFFLQNQSTTITTLSSANYQLPKPFWIIKDLPMAAQNPEEILSKIFIS